MSNESDLALAPLTEQAASRVAGWFVGDADGQREFGGFYGVHPRWWTLVEKDPRRHGWIAYEADGDAIGFVDIELADAPSIAIYMRLERRGRGLGTALVRAAATKAWELGAGALEASIRADNVPSLLSCRRAGFVETGTNANGEIVMRIDRPDDLAGG